jgi:hypothetical protein
MADTSTKEIVRRPRRTLAQIKIPGGDTLVPREAFAHDVIGVCERTAARMNLPTTYVGGIAFVAHDASLKIVANLVKRRNPAPVKRRAVA